MVLVLIFIKFGMYLTYINRFWGHFSMFQHISMYFTFGPGTGPKCVFRTWYLTLEIPVYEPLFRGSARFADVRNGTLGKKKFRVPKPQEW